MLDAPEPGSYKMIAVCVEYVKLPDLFYLYFVLLDLQSLKGIFYSLLFHLNLFLASAIAEGWVGGSGMGNIPKYKDNCSHVCCICYLMWLPIRYSFKNL